MSGWFKTVIIGLTANSKESPTFTTNGSDQKHKQGLSIINMNDQICKY